MDFHIPSELWWNTFLLLRLPHLWYLLQQHSKSIHSTPTVKNQALRERVCGDLNEVFPIGTNIWTLGHLVALSVEVQEVWPCWRKHISGASFESSQPWHISSLFLSAFCACLMIWVLSSLLWVPLPPCQPTIMGSYPSRTISQINTSFPKLPGSWYFVIVSE